MPTTITDGLAVGRGFHFGCVHLIKNQDAMAQIHNLETISEYCDRFYTSAKHPLVTTLNLTELTRRPQEGIEALRFNFYAVFLKQGKHWKFWPKDVLVFQKQRGEEDGPKNQPRK